MNSNLQKDDPISEDLRKRYEAFDVLSSRFDCYRPSGLTSVVDIPDAMFERMRLAAFIYMSKCLGQGRVILDEEEILDQFIRHEHEIRNITPNGMIVPKRHTILEYNQLVRALVDIVSLLNINDLISSWHVPLNLRIKYGKVTEGNLERHHPTEHIHSDSWAGESAESVTLMLPIFGDLPKNCVRYFDPPSDFSEEWLKPRPSYIDGKEIADRYVLNDFVPRKGQLILTDFASLHASTRLEGAGPRVSIDTTFALKRVRNGEFQETIHPWRESERLKPEVLAGIGERHLFVFPDSIDQQVDSAGGFKHPTNLLIKEIL